MLNHEETQKQQYYQYQEDEINLIDYLRVIWKWKVFIALIIILCAGASTGLTLIKYPAQQITECVISLNFPGIEKHKNPDNTLFSKDQIITPAILTRATAFLQKKDKSFSEEDIRGMIAIEAAIPIEIQEKMKKAEKKKESYTFYPNHFSLTLALEQDNIFSIKEKNRILLSIVDEYRKDFEKTYGEEPLVAIKFPADFLANSDYLDTISTFKIRVNSFIDFLDSKIAKAGFFRSQKTGSSFIDIKNDLELLNNITISKIETTIKTLKLAKNKEHLINSYKHKIRMIDVEREKKEKEASIARKLLKDMRQLEKYEPSKGAVSKKGDTNLVLDTSFIKDLIKEDSSSLLLKTALQAEVMAKNLEVDKKFLEEEIVFLKKTETGTENITFVETKLKNIKIEIIALSKRANDLNIEYLGRLINNAIQVARDTETYKARAVSMEKIVLLTSVVALFMAVFIAFFIEYIKNATNQTRETG